MGLTIDFETHSLSVDNELGIATGWNDGTLSEEGRRLAAELGERHGNDPPAAVFTSDLGRAIETVEIAFGASSIPIHPDPRLRECNYGTLNGAPVGELAATRARHVTVPFPMGESYSDVVRRVSGLIDELLTSWDGSRLVVVGHTATRWALDYLTTGAPLERLVTMPFDWKAGWRYTFD
jgi:alpha-ribazole phosphatase/probable phosphoglycerate mutase